ncbi:D-glycerate dehydrogenase [bacterium]|nr:D-glycerate dehydrogenase [bacterium]
MVKPKVYVTRRLPQPALDRLEEVFEMEVNPEDRVLTREELLENVKKCDVLLCLLTETIDGEIMDANPNLKGISNYAVGFNNIDVDAATERKLPVCNTPGVLTDTTADMAWTLMFAAARRVVESDVFIRAGKFKGWGPMMFLGCDIYGKTLGIVGAGRIGDAVARRTVGFNMKVLYYDVIPNEKLEQDIGAKRVELDELLQEADFVTVHVPLMPQTTHFISEREFKLMKKTAILINNSRGPVVDEKALIKALKSGEIAYAGLDVFEDEPELAPGLAELDNVVLTPHTSSATVETRTKMGMLAAENAIAMIEGKRPPHIVNPEVLEG